MIDAGFRPGSGGFAWCVPQGATLVDLAKGPNNGRALRDALSNSDAPSGLIRLGGRKPREGGPTRGACPEPC